MKKALRKKLSGLAERFAVFACGALDQSEHHDGFEHREWLTTASNLAVAAAQIAMVLERGPKCDVETLEPGEPLTGITCHGTTVNGDKFAF